MADGPGAMAGRDATDVAVGLARTLRAAGVDASTARVQTLVAGLARLDPARRRDVYWAGRLTLCASPADVERYDRVFAAYFGERPAPTARAAAAPHARLRAAAAGAAGPDGDGRPAPALGLASRAEVLRHRDIATLTDAERAELHRLLAALSLPGESRRSRRRVAAHRGELDRPRTVRALLRHGGEPVRPARRRRRERPRRVVLLVDVSGSMAPYADALLRFAHAARQAPGRRVEVFTLGTRLTRVTRELGAREPLAALRALGAAVPDWRGGTRLGDNLRLFLDRYGQPGTARGAVVVIASDGWERGDPRLLGEQAARLHRLAHRVVWCNPRKARPDYQPLAAGMAAALPYVDDFVSGHSLAALERLAAVVAGTARGPVPRA